MVKFDTDVGSFSTFDATAAEFLKLMGHSGSIPSAVSAEDVPHSLATVQAAIGRLPKEEQSDAPTTDDDGEEKVPLAKRAFALVELLEGAVKHNSGVRWATA